MKARTAFLEMIKYMEADNGYQFPYTPIQEALAVKAIEKMLEAGWQPWATTQAEGVLTESSYINDMEAITCGEETDMERLAKHWSGGVELKAVLDGIFDQS